ncbi:uncharacterized protein EV154DRAFT_467562 [Mucor mucedo]|uniref:uncharacterized protein n=1 Tax=Mucor mucedo TaxID=29922 RepID=UPI0022207CBB|nr:uncharacterized protein EV154DRAFT_467562 [Mucor mucedo]KAI7889312.1 hypothetical protein EV154DRAFT_467562 [Mucor mucedo]
MSDQCANPQYRDWVKEWMEQAQTLGSKAYYTYKKAYESLDKCTDVFNHPSETVKLAGIGPGLALKLENALKKYCKDNGLPMPESSSKGKRKKPTTQSGDALEDTTTPVRPRPSKPYVPKYRTGGYGILLCLFEIYQGGRENLTKDQICRAAQEHCDASYTMKDPGSSYTAWNSMKTLLEKGYIYKSGSPAKFRLTETGISLSERLKVAQSARASQGNGEGSSTQRITNGESSEPLRNPSTARSRKKATGSSTITSSQQPSQRLTQTQTQQNEVDYNELIDNQVMESLLPHEYEIVLVLDSREIQMKNDRDYFQRKLAENGVKFITRSMDLGDVIWIARKIGNTNQNEELFLDYVVERKRLDDLVSSIKDGRYTEQKTRLKRSGAEKVMYVVEEYNRADAVNFGVQAVQTAMSSLQIIDGFFLKTTEGVDETIAFFVSVTKLIHQIYKNTVLYTIPGHIITRQNYLSLKKACKDKSNRHVTEKSAYLITYPMFSQLNTKNGGTTVHEIFIRMLSTIQGVNAERALSLIKIYPTPNALLKAYNGKTPQQGKILAKEATQHEIGRRRWALKISERLYNLFGAISYPDPTGESDDD